MILQPGGEISEHTDPANDGFVHLAALQAAVGGSIECVSLIDEIDLWVHEEGLIIGLPLNAFATGMCAAANVINYLVGPCAVTGGCDEEGNTMGLTEAAIAGIRSMRDLTYPHLAGR